MTLPLDRVLAEIAPLAANGASFHWLHPESKRPIGDKWSEKPFRDLETLKKTHEAGNNVGLRLGEFSKTPWGYLLVLDVDVRAEEHWPAAKAKLLELWPDALSFPIVRSGSGGASMHIYFFCQAPFRSKKLAKSTGFTMVWSEEKGREVKKHDWEIELFGTGKQVVVPPSIHPDTKRPYVWERHIDTGDLDLGIGPVVSADVVGNWGARQDEAAGGEFDDDADWLYAEIKGEPIGLSEDEIQKIVDDLPDDWADDRDGWYQTGMALHHEFRGGKRGFEIWCAWSQQSDKYDEKDQKRVWKSFGKSNRTNPVRMPTLIQAAKAARFDREDLDLVADDGTDEFADLDDADEFEDLLGGTPTGGELDLTGGEGELDLTGGADDDDTGGEVSWRSKLDLNDDAQPKSTLPNIQLILENDPRLQGCVAFNEFSKNLVFIHPPRIVRPRKESPKGHFQFQGPVWQVDDSANGRAVQDEHLHSIRLWLETPRRQGGWALKVADRDLKAALINACHAATIHPLRDKLKRLHENWDGVLGRLETMFIRYLGCPDTPYHRHAARLFGIAAVARIQEPGCKWDFMPILEGGQGKRKSSFIRAMGIGYAGELDFDYRDKKGMIESCLGRWIMEFPELVGFSKADSEHMKRYITTTSDDYRVPYATFQSRILRAYVFVGSTNDSAYLRDPTGNRRYWPIKVRVEGHIDTDAFEQEWPLMLGEAMHLYREMRAAQPHGDLPLYLTDPDACREAEQLQAGARVESSADVFGNQLRMWLDTPIDAEFEDLDGEEPQFRDRICTATIWKEFMEQDARRAIPANELTTITTAMKHMPDWEPRATIRFDDGNRTRGWVRVGEYPARQQKVRLLPGKRREPDEELDLLG